MSQLNLKTTTSIQYDLAVPKPGATVISFDNLNCKIQLENHSSMKVTFTYKLAGAAKAVDVVLPGQDSVVIDGPELVYINVGPYDDFVHSPRVRITLFPSAA